ncbi:unnamed protein product, partial [Amoebophrya sp. A25]
GEGGGPAVLFGSRSLCFDTAQNWATAEVDASNHQKRCSLVPYMAAKKPGDHIRKDDLMQMKLCGLSLDDAKCAIGEE